MVVGIICYHYLNHSHKETNMIFATLNGINVNIPNQWQELTAQQVKDVQFCFSKFNKTEHIRRSLLLVVFNVKKSWKLKILFFWKATLQGLESLYPYTKFLDNPLKSNFLDIITFDDFATLDNCLRKMTTYPVDDKAKEKFFIVLNKYTQTQCYQIQETQHNVCIWYYNQQMELLRKSFPNIFVKSESKSKHTNDKYGWEAIADEFAPSPADIEAVRNTKALDVLMRFDRQVQKMKEQQEYIKSTKRR